MKWERRAERFDRRGHDPIRWAFRASDGRRRGVDHRCLRRWRGQQI